MKRVVFTVTAALVLALVGWASAQDEVSRGKQLYEEKKCRMCHNLGGVGNPRGAALDDVGSKHAHDVLRMWLINPREMAQKAGSTRKPPMTSLATLPPEDIDALVAYLSTLKKAAR